MSEEFTFLLDHLADESRPVRALNLAPLSDLPRALLPRLRAACQAFAPPRRLELVHVMVEQAEANIHLCFHTVFRECLTDADAQVRRLAVEGLWEDERPSLVSPLLTLLTADPAVEVRAAAAISLGRFMLMGVLGEISDGYAAQVKSALTAAWNRPGETTEVRRRALEALAYLNEQVLYALMDSAYYDEDELMRQSAIFAMGRSADPRWAKYVLAELGSVEAAMRFEAASAAGELGLTIAVKPMIRLLDDPDSHVREAVILALGKIGGPAAKRALQACQRSKDERMAEAAGEALEELAFNSDLNDAAAAGSRRASDSDTTPGEEDEDDDLADEAEDEDDDLLDEEFGLGGALDGFDDEAEDEDDEWDDDDDDDEDADEWDDDDLDELDEDESLDTDDENDRGNWR